MNDRPIEAAQTSADKVLVPAKITPQIEAAIKEVAPKWYAPSVWGSLLDAAGASAPPAAATVPGHKLTPHQPTKEMLQAGAEQWHRVGTPADAWMAMRHAAPEVATPTAQKAEGGEVPAPKCATCGESEPFTGSCEIAAAVAGPAPD